MVSWLHFFNLKKMSLLWRYSCFGNERSRTGQCSNNTLTKRSSKYRKATYGVGFFYHRTLYTDSYPVSENMMTRLFVSVTLLGNEIPQIRNIITRLQPTHFPFRPSPRRLHWLRQLITFTWFPCKYLCASSGCWLLMHPSASISFALLPPPPICCSTTLN